MNTRGNLIYIKDIMDKKELSKKAFDKQAGNYDFDKNGKHARKQYKHILNKVDKLKFSNVLDVGFGTGEILKNIMEKYPDKNYYGIDISENMLKKAGEKLKNEANLSLTLGDSENLPYEDEKFDLILVNDSFHHYPNPNRVVREIFRVLKKRGHLILSDYYKSFFIRLIMNTFISFSIDGDVKIYSKREMENFLKEAGFKIIDAEILNSALFFTAKKQ